METAGNSVRGTVPSGGGSAEHARPWAPTCRMAKFFGTLGARRTASVTTGGAEGFRRMAPHSKATCPTVSAVPPEKAIAEGAGAGGSGFRYVSGAAVGAGDLAHHLVDVLSASGPGGLSAFLAVHCSAHPGAPCSWEERRRFSALSSCSGGSVSGCGRDQCCAEAGVASVSPCSTALSKSSSIRTTSRPARASRLAAMEDRNPDAQ